MQIVQGDNRAFINPVQYLHYNITPFLKILLKIQPNSDAGGPKPVFNWLKEESKQKSQIVVREWLVHSVLEEKCVFATWVLIVNFTNAVKIFLKFIHTWENRDRERERQRAKVEILMFSVEKFSPLVCKSALQTFEKPLAPPSLNVNISVGPTAHETWFKNCDSFRDACQNLFTSKFGSFKGVNAGGSSYFECEIFGQGVKQVLQKILKLSRKVYRSWFLNNRNKVALVSRCRNKNFPPPLFYTWLYGERTFRIQFNMFNLHPVNEIHFSFEQGVSISFTIPLEWTRKLALGDIYVVIGFFQPPHWLKAVPLCRAVT